MFADLVVWELPRPLAGSVHPYTLANPDQLMTDFFNDIQQVKR